MLTINEKEFASTIANGVTLVDFFATWCGPCKMLAPVLEEVAEELKSKVNIVKVDVDQDGDLAMQFQIMSVPTMLVFKDGELKKTLQGFMPKVPLIQALEAEI